MERFVNFVLLIAHRVILAVFLFIAASAVVYVIADPPLFEMGGASVSSSAGRQLEQIEPDTLPGRYIRWLFGDTSLDPFWDGRDFSTFYRRYGRTPGIGTFEGVLRGDLGTSHLTGQPITEMLGERRAASLELLIPALILSFLIGVPLGIIMALLRRSFTDSFIRPIPAIASAIPFFWLGLVLIYFYYIEWDILPVDGRSYTGDVPLSERLDNLVLPLATLSIFWTACVALYVRSATLKTFSRAQTSTFNASAILQGLLVFPPLAIPTALAGIWGSLSVVEAMFRWQGVGWLMYEAARRQDHPLLMGGILLIIIGIILIYLVFHIFSALTLLITGAPVEGYIVAPQFYLAQITEGQTGYISPSQTQKGLVRGVVELFFSLLASLALTALVSIMFLALFASVINKELIKHDPDTRSRSRYLDIGEDDHPLGTDDLGRDEAARLLIGGRTTLGIGFASALVALTIGAIVGGSGGMLNGMGMSLKNKWLGSLISGVFNLPLNWGFHLFSIFPVLLLLMLIGATKDPGTNNFILIFGLLCSVYTIPVIRAQVSASIQVITSKMRKASRDSVNASQVSTSDANTDQEKDMGATVISEEAADIQNVEAPVENDHRILDNTAPPDNNPSTNTAPAEDESLASITYGRLFRQLIWLFFFLLLFTMLQTILLESVLSFLGLGVDYSTPSWGNMLTDSFYFMHREPRLFFIPGLALTFTMLCLYIVMEHVRDTLDITW